ncbi:MAG: DUF3800 domain-containing protein [Candidatus Chisholmbacteria bacterium]|nr:DUF3800 domain-containing protein [Candidatus Chisholmbacteria bacterium]
MIYSDQFNEKIKRIEADLRLDSFHWSEERWDVRNKFLTEIVKLDFTAKVAIFKNPVRPEKMMKVVFQHLITEGKIRNIFLDGKKPKWYELSLKKALRDKGVSVRKLRTVNDKSQPGVQVADCIAGLVRRHYDNQNEENSRRWFDKLKREKKLIMQLLFEG